MTVRNHRNTIANVSFLLLVIVIPVAFGIGWSEHQRTSDIQRLQRAQAFSSVLDDWQIYDGLLAACRRGNVIRRKQNAVIEVLHEQFGFTIPKTRIPDCLESVPMPTVPRPKTTGGGNKRSNK